MAAQPPGHPWPRPWPPPAQPPAAPWPQPRLASLGRALAGPGRALAGPGRAQPRPPAAPSRAPGPPWLRPRPPLAPGRPPAAPCPLEDHEATQEGLNYSVPSHQDFAPVHDGILEDVVFPVEYGEACQIFLDLKERNNTEYKLMTYTTVYRRLCGKDVVFEYPMTNIA
uniref:40S ribosomal protein S7 n=1 Tax=Zea mays TaxID=4577 RepID=A0A804NTD1_MAIZE